MAYEEVALVFGILLGVIIAYLILTRVYTQRSQAEAEGLASRMFETRKAELAEQYDRIAAVKAEQIADQRFEQKREVLEKQIQVVYESKLETWRATDLQALLEKSRADAVGRSRMVLKGKIGEQLAPLLPEFLQKYDPADARFIGNPIDYVVFVNHSKLESEDLPFEVVILDVKTGKADLNKAERRIRDAVREGRVRFETLRLGTLDGEIRGIPALAALKPAVSENPPRVNLRPASIPHKVVVSAAPARPQSILDPVRARKLCKECGSDEIEADTSGIARCLTCGFKFRIAS